MVNREGEFFTVMGGNIQHLKIFWTIICSIVINMMNKLILLQRTPIEDFNNSTMFVLPNIRVCDFDQSVRSVMASSQARCPNGEVAWVVRPFTTPFRAALSFEFLSRTIWRISGICFELPFRIVYPSDIQAATTGT